MKKIYLMGMIAASLMFGSVNAQAQCENAQAWTTMYMSSAEAWFNVSVTSPSMFSMSGATSAEVEILEGCDGKSAFIMDEDVAMNTIAFYLLPDVEYKLHVAQGEVGAYRFMMSSTLDLSRAPEGLYSVKPIVINPGEEGITRQLRAGATTWFQRDLAYPAPVNVTPSMFSDKTGNVTGVEVHHLTYDGPVNYSTSDLTPGYAYAKAGINIIGITADGEQDVTIALDAVNATGCGNRPQYASAIALDTKTSYANAYYTLDYRFTVPEDGTYTFTNFGAEGTDFSLALLKNEDGTNVCDFESNPLSAVVGEDNQAVISASYKTGDVVLLHSDAYSVLAEGEPYMLVEKGGDGSGVQSVGLSAEREIAISNQNNGSFTVSSYLFNENAEVYVFDMNARKIYGSAVAADTTEKFVELNGVPAGTYLVVVMGRNRSASAKLIVK